MHIQKGDFRKEVTKKAGFMTAVALIVVAIISLCNSEFAAATVDSVLAVFSLAYYNDHVTEALYYFVWGVIAAVVFVAAPFEGSGVMCLFGALAMITFFVSAFDSWRLSY